MNPVDQMMRAVGAATQKPRPETPPPPWKSFAKGAELERLAILQERTERSQQSLNELSSEHQKIMNRCIRRMRRASGKN